MKRSNTSPLFSQEAVVLSQRLQSYYGMNAKQTTLDLIQDFGKTLLIDFIITLLNLINQQNLIKNEAFIQKFLKVNEFDQEKAFNAFIKCIDWREKNGIEGINEQKQNPLSKFFFYHKEDWKNQPVGYTLFIYFIIFKYSK